jgi:hypothetical protein
VKLNRKCKVYGSRILIQAQLTVSTNKSDNDIIPHLPLEFDCREVQGGNCSLNDMHLNLTLNDVILRLYDMNVAKHKLDEVQKLTEEQEWKMRQSNVDYHLSFLTYVGMATTTLIFF